MLPLPLVLLDSQVVSRHRTTCWLRLLWWLSMGHARLCDPMNCSTSGLPCPSPSPRVCSDSCRLSPWCHATRSFAFVPFSSCPQSFPHQGVFQWTGSSNQVAKVLELHLRHQFFQWKFRVDFLWLRWLSCKLHEGGDYCWNVYLYLLSDTKYFTWINNPKPIIYALSWNCGLWIQTV